MADIYNLINDKERIKKIQAASLDAKSPFGFKPDNGLLFGSTEWFNAISEGKIRVFDIVGEISDVISSGHNDFIEFEIESNGVKSLWPLLGKAEKYSIGKTIKLTYVEQKFKRPTDITGVISKCIIRILEN